MTRRFLLYAITLLLASCSNTKHLPPGDSLFVGGRVTVKDKEVPRRERKVIATDLKDAIKPTPNRKTLGVRLKLSIYNLAGEPKKNKGFKYWLRTKVGEPPVLTSQFDMEANRKLMVNILENRGFFYPKVNGTTETRRKKTKAKFEVYTGKQYKMRNIEFVNDSSTVSTDMVFQKEKTLLKTGTPYNLDLIKAERERIDRRMKEIGYYYFKADYILMQIDSTVGENQVDVFVKVKEEIPVESAEKYFIRNVYIYPRYRVGQNVGGRMRNINRRDQENIDSSRRAARRNLPQQDTTFYERYYIIGNKLQNGRMAYKPFIFTQAMQFHPHELYNRTEQNIALNRLINMGTFKFVKNDFDRVDTNQLDVFYYLTPYPKKALRVELGGLTKNDSRVGSQITLSWRNRNTFRGAELFAIKGSAGFETQYGGQVRRPNTYQFGFEPSLTFPRFIIPGVDPKSSSMFVPRTTIKAGYDLLIRQGLYRLNSFHGNYGYSWKEDVRKEHQLFPINITYVKTDTLNKDTTISINYSNLVFNGLIIGPTYQYTFNSRGNGAPNRDDYYFDILADLSGNVLGIAQNAKVNEGATPKTLFGAAYAQYVKVQTDFRYYRNYGAHPNSIWANRLIIGLGYPYGNSTQLPNVKQFFSGGNSSLRGFPSRLLGPGAFYYKQNPNRIFIETSGDIKLELNTELRFPIIGFLNGALFVDAGNIWTYRKNPLFPGGEFTSAFLNQLGVSAGPGLRFDFKILVLRLDLGLPLRKPWLTEGNKWAVNDIKLMEPEWRKDNLILNIGIGYPF
jgi:outer membrane protein insertion porin family